MISVRTDADITAAVYKASGQSLLVGSPLSDLGLVKIFSQSVGCLFVLLTVSFALQKQSPLHFYEVPFVDS